MMPQELMTDWEGFMYSTPHRGEVPMTYHSKIEQEGARTQVIWEVNVPQEFSRDLATLIAVGAAELGLKSSKSLSD